MQAIEGARGTKIIGVLPGDVSLATMMAVSQWQELSSEAINLEIKQAELKKIVEDLAARLRPR